MAKASKKKRTNKGRVNGSTGPRLEQLPESVVKMAERAKDPEVLIPTRAPAAPFNSGPARRSNIWLKSIELPRVVVARCAAP